MRRRTWVAAALVAPVAATCVIGPRVARAEDARVYGTLSAGVGASDNVGFVATRPSDSVVDARCGDGTWSPPRGPSLATPICNVDRRIGPIFNVSPGVVLTLESPRARYQAGYTFTASASPAMSSYANRIQLGGAFVTGPTTELALGGHVAQGSTSALQLTADAGGAQPGGASAAAGVAALPSASLTYVSGGVTEELTKELSPALRVSQGLALSANTPVLRSATNELPYRSTTSVAATGGVERSWRRDALGLLARVDLVTQVQVDAVGPAADPTAPPASTASTTRRAVIDSLVATYKRDFGHFLGGELQAGVLQVSSLGTGAVLVQPTGLAAVRFTRLEGTAELAFSHTALPNPLLGVNLLSDTLTLRGAVPLDRRARWLAATSSGFAHTRQILDDGSLAPPTNILRGDVTLGYLPTPAFQLALRYQHHRQLPTAGAGVDAPSGAVGTGEISVSTLLLTGTVVFPPQDQPPLIFRPPLRVDRADGAAFSRDPPPPPPPSSSTSARRRGGAPR